MLVNTFLKFVVLPAVFFVFILSHSYNQRGVFYTVQSDTIIDEAAKHRTENALKGLVVSHGLEVSMVATEPMLINPTNIDVDERGRIWVTEAYNYRPVINGNPTNPEGDRIIVLQDNNGDGKADESK